MKIRYRFPGGGFPFTETDKNVFNGRQHAIEYIHNSILLNQCILIYGRTGVGKTSLLQAGVIPMLKHKVSSDMRNSSEIRVFSVRPGVFKETDTQKLVEKMRNLHVENANTRPTSQNIFLEFLPETVRSTLWYQFKSLQYHTKESQIVLLLVMDQVEEFFTYPANHFEELITEITDLRSSMLPIDVRRAVEKYETEVRKLLPEENAVLYKQLPVKFVFSIRSDKLYLVGRLKITLPEILHNTYEVFPFNEEEAKQAMKNPSQENGKFSSPKFDLTGASDYIIQFLFKLQRHELEENSQERRIEPYALQIICQHIERKLVIGQGQRKITPGLLENLDKILTNFYLDTLEDLDLEEGMYRRVRELIEDRMILDKYRLRNQVFVSVIHDEVGIDNKTFERLVDCRLIRETTPGSRLFEISHDILLGSILNARAERKEHESTIKRRYDSGSRDRRIVALKDLDERIKQRAFDYTLYRDKAELLYSKQEFEEAEKMYRKAVELSGNQYDEEMTIGLANCYFGLKRYSDSNKELYKIIEKSPENKIALYYIGYNYSMLGEYENAISFYLKVLALEPDYHAVNYDLGLVYLSNGQYEEVEMHFKKVIASYQVDWNFYLQLIAVLLEQRKYDEALQYAERMIADYPQNAELYSKLGRTYSDNLMYEKAIDYYKESIRIDPQNHVVHADIGVAYNYMGINQKSIIHFRKASKLNPQNALYHAWIGFLLQLQNKAAEALKYLGRAVLYNPRYRYGRAALAACYRRIGDEIEYKKQVKIAAEMPGEDEDQYTLACFEALCGNADKAIYYLEQAVRTKRYSRKFLEEDIDFDFIKNHPSFITLLESVESEKTEHNQLQ